MGRMLASGSGDNTVRVGDTGSGKTLRELRSHTGTVSSVAWSPEGRTLATGSGDHTVRLWDTESWQTLLGIERP